MNVKRLTREITLLRNSTKISVCDLSESSGGDPVAVKSHIRVYLSDEDMFKWEVLMIGPRRTIYSRTIFRFTVTFPSEFPLKPPVFTVVSYDRKPHPNFFPGGHVCLSTLNTEKEKGWTPVMSMEGLLLTVYSMLGEDSIQSADNSHDHEKSDNFFPSVMHDCYYITYKLLVDEPNQVIRNEIYDYISTHKDWYLRKLRQLGKRYDGKSFPNYYLERDINFEHIRKQIDEIVL